MALCGLTALFADPFFILYAFRNNAPLEEEEICCEWKCPCTRDAVIDLFSVEAWQDVFGRLTEAFWAQ
jgi:hypothetical protein